MPNLVKLVEDVVAFVFDALTSYATTPQGAAQLSQIIVDIEAEFGAAAASYAKSEAKTSYDPGVYATQSGKIPHKAGE